MAACDKCSFCSFDYYQVIAEFYNNDAKSLAFFRSHSVLPAEIICPHCFSNCNYREDQSVWHCRKSSVVPKSKKRRFCGFSVSDYKGTFLDNSNIAPWAPPPPPSLFKYLLWGGLRGHPIFYLFRSRSRSTGKTRNSTLVSVGVIVKRGVTKKHLCFNS